MPRISQMFTDEYGNPTSIPMKIAQCWEVEDQEVPGGRRSIPSQGSPDISTLVFQWIKSVLDVINSIRPMISVSRKMSVEEVAALIDQTMEESITRRNSAVRRGMISPL